MMIRGKLKMDLKRGPVFSFRPDSTLPKHLLFYIMKKPGAPARSRDLSGGICLPKLLFFDLDGTLFDDHGQLPASVPPALRAARERDCLLFLNTGRTLCNLDPRLKILPLDGVVMGCGARIVLHDRTLRALELSAADTLRLRDLVLASGVPLVWECDTAMYFDPEGPSHPAISGFRSFADHAGIARDIRPDDPEFRAVKMFAFAASREIRAMLDRFRALSLPFRAIERHPIGWEIVPAGCSKASGIDRLREELDVPLSDCYAFGDSENDLSMLEHVPNSIAMGNAPEAVRRCCTYVAPRPEEDGIAEALKALRLV